MVQPFLPNSADAALSIQAEPDSVDFDILVGAHELTGVVSGCAVSEDPTTPDMTVDVAVGTVRIAGTTVSVTAQANNTITTAHATLDRIDVVSVNDSGTVVVTAGTAAAIPVAPNVPGSSCPLAFVYVPASDTTIANNQIVDKRIWVDDTGSVYNIVDYGADPTGATDSTTAINAAITAAEADSGITNGRGSNSGGDSDVGGGTVVADPGVYLVSGVLQVENAHIDMGSPVIFVVSNTYNGDVWTIGTPGGGTDVTCDSRFLRFPKMVYGSISGTTLTRSTGWTLGGALDSDRAIVFKNSNECIVEVPLVQGFSYGLVLEGDGSVGVAYTTVRSVVAHECGIGISCVPINSGWSNENRFLSGQIRFANIGGTPPYSNTRAVKDTGNNNLYSLALEGSTWEYVVERGGAGYNLWLNCRWENSSDFLINGATAYANDIIMGGYEAGSLGFVLSGGATQVPTVISNEGDGFQNTQGTYAQILAQNPANTDYLRMYKAGTAIPSLDLAADWMLKIASGSIAAKNDIDTYQRIQWNTALGQLKFGPGTSDVSASIGSWSTNNMLNIEATDGMRLKAGTDATWFRTYDGTPEGNISASKAYLVHDYTNGELYVKKTASGSSGWKPVGGIANEYATAVTLDWGDSVVNIESTAATRTVTLPDNATYSGKRFLIRRDGTNNVTINRTGSDTFDDAATSKTLGSDSASIDIFSIGDGEWKIVGTSGTVT